MSFAEAVRSGFQNYVNFSGRSSRPEYWWWFLFAILAAIGAGIIDAIIGVPVVTILVGLGLFLPGLAVAIRRLHDTNRSGWWILIGIIPVIGTIVLIVFYVQRSDPGENNHGPPPADQGGVQALT